MTKYSKSARLFYPETWIFLFMFLQHASLLKSEDRSSYISLHKRTRRCQATSLLPSSEAKHVPGQFFNTNFNTLKAAPICTTWRGSKGAVSVVVADRRSGKHQSWLCADTGTKTGYSFFCLFARRHPTHNLGKYQISESCKVFLMAIFLGFAILTCL